MLQYFFWEIACLNTRIRFVEFRPLFGRRDQVDNPAGRDIVDEVVGKKITYLRKGRVVAEQEHRIGLIGEFRDNGLDLNGQGLVNGILLLDGIIRQAKFCCKKLY